MGVYGSLAAIYFQTIKYNFEYIGRCYWLLKLPSLIIALIYSLPLLCCALFFQILVLLDIASSLVSTIRQSLLSYLERSSFKVKLGLIPFLFQPIAIMCVSPILFITFLLPKFSSNNVDNLLAKSAIGGFVGAGAFKKVSKSTLNTVKNLFFYVSNNNVFIMPILACVAIIYSLILLALATIFIILIPLDWISDLIEKTRRAILITAKKIQVLSRSSFFGFLFSTISLVILAPLFFFVLIVPKLTNHVDPNV